VRGLIRRGGEWIGSLGVMLPLAFITLSAAAIGFAAAAPAEGPVVVVTIDGTINPATADLLSSTLRTAELKDARLVVIQLDTPGGLLPSMQSMVEALLAAKVPTVVYVTPRGGSAMSAGVFVAMAANVAAMAPGTTIGAAHPIGATGQDLQGHAAEKLENYAVSLARAVRRAAEPERAVG